MPGMQWRGRSKHGARGNTVMETDALRDGESDSERKQARARARVLWTRWGTARHSEAVQAVQEPQLEETP
eukprot:1932188-Rhodomonas_salina.1